jgi:hypothetical protein
MINIFVIKNQILFKKKSTQLTSNIIWQQILTSAKS